MKNNKGFNLLSVIIIISITSIISGITTGVIVTNSYKNSTGLTYNEILNDNYLNEFLEVYSSIIDNYYEDVDKEEMLDNAMDAMLEYLGDNYTTHLDSGETAELEKKLSGKYRGIGIAILQTEIVTVYKNTPAETAGLQVGDIIKSVNGKEFTIESGSQDIADLITNSKNDTIQICVLRGEEELSFEVKVETINTVDAEYKMLENNIGYIKMTIFSKTLSEQVTNALNDMKKKKKKKLIIDLRDNTGGYLESAEETASTFLKKGKLIYSLENKDATVKYYDETDGYKNYPIVVLINENSASASEILAAALKDSYGATLVGAKSFGKGKVQQTYNLSDGSMAKYTSAKWLRPNGECIDGIGITPDYNVIKSVTQDANGNIINNEDNQLLKAIEVISAL